MQCIGNPLQPPNHRNTETPKHLLHLFKIPGSIFDIPFHVDHVIPRAAGGETTYKNLALAFPPSGTD